MLGTARRGVVLKLAQCTFAVALVGCAATIDDSTTLAGLSAAGKAGVVLRVDMMSDMCPTTEVVLGRKAGDSYERVATVNQITLSEASRISRAELDPGEYHVVSIACGQVNSKTILGRSYFGTYQQSYGRFEVRAGEIVNIGNLKLIFVGPKTVRLAVDEIPSAYLDSFRKAYPNLAAGMQTRLLELPTPRRSGADIGRFLRPHHS